MTKIDSQGMQNLRERLTAQVEYQDIRPSLLDHLHDMRGMRDNDRASFPMAIDVTAAAVRCLGEEDRSS